MAGRIGAVEGPIVALVDDELLGQDVDV